MGSASSTVFIELRISCRQSELCHVLWRGNSVKQDTEAVCQTYTASPFTCTTFLSGDYSFCSFDCAGADKHITVKERARVRFSRPSTLSEGSPRAPAALREAQRMKGQGTMGRRMRRRAGPTHPRRVLRLQRSSLRVSLAACIKSARIVPSLLEPLTASKTLFAKKRVAFKEVGFEVRTMAKETRRMLEEKSDRGKEDAMLLAKVAGLEEGIARCTGGRTRMILFCASSLIFSPSTFFPG